MKQVDDGTQQTPTPSKRIPSTSSSSAQRSERKPRHTMLAMQPNQSRTQTTVAGRPPTRRPSRRHPPTRVQKMQRQCRCHLRQQPQTSIQTHTQLVNTNSRALRKQPRPWPNPSKGINTCSLRYPSKHLSNAANSVTTHDTAQANTSAPHACHH